MPSVPDTFGAEALGADALGTNALSAGPCGPRSRTAGNGARRRAAAPGDGASAGEGVTGRTSAARADPPAAEAPCLPSPPAGRARAARESEILGAVDPLADPAPDEAHYRDHQELDDVLQDILQGGSPTSALRRRPGCPSDRRPAPPAWRCRPAGSASAVVHHAELALAERLRHGPRHLGLGLDHLGPIRLDLGPHLLLLGHRHGPPLLGLGLRHAACRPRPGRPAAGRRCCRPRRCRRCRSRRSRTPSARRAPCQHGPSRSGPGSPAPPCGSSAEPMVLTMPSPTRAMIVSSAGAADQPVEVGPHRHAGLGLQLDAVLATASTPADHGRVSRSPSG